MKGYKAEISALMERLAIRSPPEDSDIVETVGILVTNLLVDTRRIADALEHLASPPKGGWPPKQHSDSPT